MIQLQDLEKELENGADAVQQAVSGAASGFRWFDAVGVTEMLIRFGFFLLVLFFIVYLLYYRKTHRRDYFFTLVLLSVSIFFLIYLLGSVKVKIGFALGLFAIFGVLRYRTETIPVREMSYMCRAADSQCGDSAAHLAVRDLCAAGQPGEQAHIV